MSIFLGVKDFFHLGVKEGGYANLRILNLWHKFGKMEHQSLNGTLASHPSYQVLYKRVKYPRITIKPNFQVLISVPLFFTPLEAQELIDKHQDWINKSLIKLAQDHFLQDLQGHDGEILFFGEWISLSSLPSNPKAYLKAQLQEDLFAQVRHYSKLMGLEFTEIKITNALSRFGSCTYDHRLLFSFMLIFAPRKLIAYVVVHELAHIRHKNHSKAFWDLVERYCPSCKSLRASLRKKARIYPELIQRLSSLTHTI